MSVARAFDGRVILVSGACGGFGRALAARFSGEGARLVLTDLARDKLEALAASLDCETVILPGDISSPATSHAVVEAAVRRFGRLDIAVNNAGIAHPFQPLPELETDVAERVIAVDLMGVFFAMQAQIPVMERQFGERGESGAIVNLASIAGLVGAPGLSIYAAAKHGVVGLTKTAALECARKGIRVNAVCPSFSPTPMVAEIAADPACGEQQIEQHLARGIPMRRLAEVKEVVEAVLFAASPANGFMTGHAIAVDGGLSAG